MKIGFIGCGNMAKAIIKGVISGKVFEQGDINASAKSFDALSSFCAENGINAQKSNALCAQNSDIIILAVKPQMFGEVLPEIAEFAAEKAVISIAAGKNISFIKTYLPKSRIIRIMPNLCAQIGCSVSALCAEGSCTEQDLTVAKSIFKSIGSVYEIDEKNFSAFSAAACCSPAFSFMYIDALAKAASDLGLDEKTALECAAQSVIGSAKLLLNSSDSPQELVNKVCSPGGTTIEGVNTLREREFEKTLTAAVKASYEKDKKL